MDFSGNNQKKINVAGVDFRPATVVGDKTRVVSAFCSCPGEPWVYCVQGWNNPQDETWSLLWSEGVVERQKESAGEDSSYFVYATIHHWKSKRMSSASWVGYKYSMATPKQPPTCTCLITHLRLMDALSFAAHLHLHLQKAELPTEIGAGPPLFSNSLLNDFRTRDITLYSRIAELSAKETLVDINKGVQGKVPLRVASFRIPVPPLFDDTMPMHMETACGLPGDQHGYCVVPTVLPNQNGAAFPVYCVMLRWHHLEHLLILYAKQEDAMLAAMRLRRIDGALPLTSRATWLERIRASQRYVKGSSQKTGSVTLGVAASEELYRGFMGLPVGVRDTLLEDRVMQDFVKTAEKIVRAGGARTQIGSGYVVDKGDGVGLIQKALTPPRMRYKEGRPDGWTST